ncbi:YceI family protein [Altererythrobacter lauratis]|uniref:YceI family protein n=1 Tax=Alteraurantiacibacter lauratis TaxID=2054627 RepID=A0ABV7EBR7_9SPHN
MRKTLLSIAAAGGLTALVAGGINAQGGPPQLPGAVDASRVTAGTYATDASHSLVGWKVNHFGFNDYFGIFGDVAGTLEIDPANLNAAKVDVTIPIASVVTASAGLTEHLMRAGANGGNPDFFGPNPAPARFVSTSVHTTGTHTAHIMGDLTLNGVTKPVTIQAEFSGAGNHPFNQRATLGFHGTATIKRSEWNLGGFVPLVGDDVELDITIAFEKQ